MSFDQAAFVKSLVYERSAPIVQLQPAVEQMRELDKRYETLAGRWMAAAGLSTIAAVCLGFYALLQHGQADALAKAGFVVAAAATVVSWGMRIYTKRRDTEDRRYLLLARVLRLLKSDVADDAPLKVRLDLNRPDQRHKFVRKGKARGWKVKYYRDDWLTLQGKFLDGTAFQVTASELFQRRSRWATSRSGKLKHKTKTKTATEFAVRLKPKAKRYQRLTELGGGARRALQLPKVAAVKALSVQDGGLVLKVKCKRPWVQSSGSEAQHSGSRIIALMFLSLYQVLNLSRRLTKKAG